MLESALFIVAIIIGLTVLGWSAGRFVAGASGLARSYNISPMIIGLTITAMSCSPLRGEFDNAVLTRDFPLMIALTLALYLMARGMRNSAYGSINRWEGGVLLVVFSGYQLWIFLGNKVNAS